MYQFLYDETQNAVCMINKYKRPVGPGDAHAIRHVIVTKLTTLRTPPGARGVLSQYLSEVHCANDHITFNQN